MAHTHRLAIFLTALALAGGGLPARALQLGEGKTQILERHGTPGAEDRGKGVAIYFWEGWSAEIEYKEEAIHKLIYRRNAFLEPPEVTALLQSNGGAARWREVTAAGEPTRQWVRDDGAVASCLAMRPLMMTFQTGQRPAGGAPGRYGSRAAPKVVVPSIPSIPEGGSVSLGSSGKAPSFPKLLGSTPNPEKEAAAEPTEATPLAPVRSLRKLPAEELGTSPIAPANPIGRSKLLESPILASSEASEAPDTAAQNSAPVEPGPAVVESTTHGWLIGGIALAVAALLGGGVYWFKFRKKSGDDEVIWTRPATPVVPEAVREALAMRPVVTATNPALDALRSDQFELVVGEIFRREGYAVELSAAAAQGDTIDLTLRRDAETILVQCKYWKSSRVTEKEVGEFHLAMMANGAPRGIFVTAGSFSREAQEFAVGKEIDLMDRTALEESTAAVARSGEDFCKISGWIEEFAANARIFDPECPICQGAMELRPHRANGTVSWACRNHPRCPGRREARRDLLTATSAAG